MSHIGIVSSTRSPARQARMHAGTVEVRIVLDITGSPTAPVVTEEVLPVLV